MKKKYFIILSLFLISIIIVLLILINNKKNNNLIKLEEVDYKTGELITITEEELKEKENNNESFILYLHVPGLCTSTIPFDPMVNKFIKDNKITMYSLSFSLIKNTNLKDIIKYSPSLIIYKDGEILDYLDANSKEDYDYYSSYEGLTKWIESFVKI